MGETGQPGFTLAVTFTPPPCYPETMFFIAILDGNGGQLDKVYNSPDLLGPILLNLGGQAGTGNATLQLFGEPLEHGGLYQATIFTYNTSTGGVQQAVTDLDFAWEVPYPY
ncbi:uncharacterized protein PHACADRAFT_260958 [Phanerochaete carnosa HHB-10118-sp]|uniref:Uncharacterized protein n=1 Tax=Phanerochaete carnosa (strain HHB-10118-sp) TaxID=650164 RepID=K5URI7_PHACS|nr:uncharacterized protein PHACADRAFT_260958 [Phanerochaete carnosa HHB-10118-sp]EKM52506.1 hypothetical protein PHACADRAFT_260958 [Phanerochaete carnosa HHB-10118-sp]